MKRPAEISEFRNADGSRRVYRKPIGRTNRLQGIEGWTGYNVAVEQPVGADVRLTPTEESTIAAYEASKAAAAARIATTTTLVNAALAAQGLSHLTGNQRKKARAKLHKQLGLTPTLMPAKPILG